MSQRKYLYSAIVPIITSLTIAVATDTRAVASGSSDGVGMWGDRTYSVNSERPIKEFINDSRGRTVKVELYDVRDEIYRAAGVKPPFPHIFWVGPPGRESDEAMAAYVEGHWKLLFGRGLITNQPKYGPLYRSLLMAHEVGHHLLGHTSANPVWELQADWFAGCALGVRGAKLKDVAETDALLNEVVWLYKKHHQPGSTSHPQPVEKRIEQVKRGWDHGNRRHDSQPPCPRSSIPTFD